MGPGSQQEQADLWPEVMADLKPPEWGAPVGRSEGPLGHGWAPGFRTHLKHSRYSINTCLGKKDQEKEEEGGARWGGQALGSRPHSRGPVPRMRALPEPTRAACWGPSRKCNW